MLNSVYYFHGVVLAINSLDLVRTAVLEMIDIFLSIVFVSKVQNYMLMPGASFTNFCMLS